MKPVYLLDTNIVSEFPKDRPEEKVLEYYRARKNLCAISAVTWQELNRGINRMPEGKKKKSIQSLIDNLSLNLEIIPYDSFAAQICGEMQARAEAEGKTMPFYDSQIAATAVANGMILVTRNTADFKLMQDKAFLRVENWFTA